MLATYDTNAPKKATNLTINEDLLKKVKSYKINISQSFEKYLVELVKKEEEKSWLEKNRTAIEKQNTRIEQHGSFSDNIRRF